MDDHLKHRKMGEVELADALIRLLDLGGKFGWNYASDESCLDMLRVDLDSLESPAACHLACNIYLFDLVNKIAPSEFIINSSPYSVGVYYSIAVDCIIVTAQKFGYDIFGAMEEKREYNKNRLDHKRENRAKEGGKKF